MDRSDIEEGYAKCNICGKGLDVVENILLGNRCVFCYETKGYIQHKEIGLIKFMFICYYTWRIYQETKKLKYNQHLCTYCKGTKKIPNALYQMYQEQAEPKNIREAEIYDPCPVCYGRGKIQEGRTFFQACLGQVGGQDINQLKQVKQFRWLLRGLRKCK